MSELSTLSDVELMRQTQAGRDECFAELVARYRTAMLRMARSRLGRRELAEEAVQETFFSAFKGCATFDPKRNLRTWLWTILLNQCRGCLKRAARQPQVKSWSDAADIGAESGMTDELPGREPAPWDRILAEERRDQIDELLRCLSPAQADALRLRFFGGLKFQEIADTMGCSLATAKNRVRWGVLRMSHLMVRSGVPEASVETRDDGGRP